MLLNSGPLSEIRTSWAANIPPNSLAFNLNSKCLRLAVDLNCSSNASQILVPLYLNVL